MRWVLLSLTYNLRITTTFTLLHKERLSCKIQQNLIWHWHTYNDRLFFTYSLSTYIQKIYELMVKNTLELLLFCEIMVQSTLELSLFSRVNAPFSLRLLKEYLVKIGGWVRLLRLDATLGGETSPIGRLTVHIGR